MLKDIVHSQNQMSMVNVRPLRVNIAKMFASCIVMQRHTLVRETYIIANYDYMIEMSYRTSGNSTSQT